MAAGYFESGAPAIRPPSNSLSAACPPIATTPSSPASQIVDYLLNLSFTAEEIDPPPRLPVRQGESRLLRLLRDFRFTGDLAVPEGTCSSPVSPRSPSAPIIEAQLPETYLLSAVTFQT
jgi:nicotinate phosphoribosyltransferase